MRVEADKSVQHVAHESKRVSSEQVLVGGKWRAPTGDGRPGSCGSGVLPKGVRYAEGLRTSGSIAYASVYEQGMMSEAGRVAAPPVPFYLERRLACGQADSQGRVFPLWVTDTSRGRTRIDPKTGEISGLTLAAARGLAAANPQWQRVSVRDAWGRYVPEVVPGNRQAATRGKKGAAGMW